MRRPPVAYLLAALLLFVGLWLAYPHELTTGDPSIYSHNAYTVMRGTYFDSPSSHIFGHRLAVFVPVALFYKLFGIDSFTTVLWPLFAALAIVLIIWRAMPSNRSRLFALYFAIVSGALLRATTSLHPDIIATCFMALSTLLLQFRDGYQTRHGRYWILPVGAACCLFIAFLAKLSAYWILPLWMIIFISDLRRSDFVLIRRFYFPAAATLVILGIGYLLLCDYLWGNPLARLEAVQKLTGLHTWAWDNKSIGDWIERLATGPAILFLEQYGLMAMLALASIWLAPKSVRIWSYYTLCTVIFFWFGSTSLEAYEPLPLIARMTLPCLPGLCILAGLAASRITEASERRGKLIKLSTYFLLIMLSILPFARGIYYWQFIPRGETHALEIVRSQVMAKKDRKFLLICSDSRNPGTLAFHFEYEYPPNLVTAWAGDLNTDLLARNDVAFLYVDEKLSHWLKHAYGLENYDQRIRSMDLEELWNLGRVALFKCNNPPQLLALIGRDESD